MIHQILEAGFRASNTGIMQVYSVMLHVMRRKSRNCGLPFQTKYGIAGTSVLTFCADFNRFSQWCRQRQSEPGSIIFLSFTTAAIDALLVAQNDALPAENFWTWDLLPWNHLPIMPITS